MSHNAYYGNVVVDIDGEASSDASISDPVSLEANHSSAAYVAYMNSKGDWADVTHSIDYPVKSAVGTVNLDAGGVSSIDIDDAGYGYSSAPTLVIDGDGAGAVAHAEISNGINY